MAAGRIPSACQRQQMASEVARGDRRPRRYRTGCSSGSLESVTGLVALLLGRVTLTPGAAGRTSSSAADRRVQVLLRIVLDPVSAEPKSRCTHIHTNRGKGTTRYSDPDSRS